MTDSESLLEKIAPAWTKLSTQAPATDNELVFQLLEKGREHLEREGLTVTLNLSMEELAQRVGTTAAALHHLWPTRDAFLAELLILLVQPTESQGASFDPGTLEIARNVLESRLSELGTKAGREAVLMEAIRLGARRNYEYVSTSLQWRTFMALVVSAPGLDEVHRLRVFDALQQAEDRFIDRMTDFYDEMLPRFLATPLPGLSTRHIAAVGAAVVEGLAVRETVNAKLVGTPIPLGADGTEWHLAAVGFASIIRGMVELKD